MKNQHLRLCLVTHPNHFEIFHHTQIISQAVAGGVTCLQYRDKSNDLNLIYPRALELKRLLASKKIPLIINDHVEIAQAVNAEGVHLGQSDCSPHIARKILGNEKIIGLSIETWEQLDRANQLSYLNYVAISAVFPSKTKIDCKTYWGLDGLSKAVLYSRHPVVAIGGINSDNAAQVFEQGVEGVAVISALYDAQDPAAAAMKIFGNYK